MDLSVTPDHAASASLAETPNGTNRQRQGPSIRSSCDRCHRQKLRCRRNAESATCNRCQRLNAPCHYSRRGSKPSTVYKAVDVFSEAPRVTSVTEEIGFILPPTLRAFDLEESIQLSPCIADTLSSSSSFQDLSWSGILPTTIEGSDEFNTFLSNWDILPLTHDSSCGFPLVEHSIDARAQRHDSDPRDDFEIRCRASRKLATLSVALYESVMPFPMLEKIRVTAEKATTVENKTRQTVKLIFDQLFEHTKDFNHVIQSLFSSPGQEDQITLYPDEALVSLIFSCHCQLAEAYTSLLNMIRACLEHSIAPPTNTNWAVILPKLQVGSVALPSLQVDNKNPMASRATSHMYMTSITTVTALLWTQMMSAVKAVTTSQENTLSRYGSTAAVMWDAMSRRTDEVVRRIELVGSLL
ncbi:uncharacterized protein TrAtP1_010356 [Trichoderma atroviride]|uniref:uncharacterized protein n=1 Tax=Hypocrea atroviridis TaxID=63577 RepID=UPI003333A428|nr:hypothetical protein TrAtP1_010356 [Trichoderma atroviride]